MNYKIDMDDQSPKHGESMSLDTLFKES